MRFQSPIDYNKIQILIVQILTVNALLREYRRESPFLAPLSMANSGVCQPLPRVLTPPIHTYTHSIFSTHTIDCIANSSVYTRAAVSSHSPTFIQNSSSLTYIFSSEILDQIPNQKEEDVVSC